MTRPIYIPPASTSLSVRPMHVHCYCLATNGHLTCCLCHARQGVTFYVDERDDERDEHDEEDADAAHQEGA